MAASMAKFCSPVSCRIACNLRLLGILSRENSVLCAKRKAELVQTPKHHTSTFYQHRCISIPSRLQQENIVKQDAETASTVSDDDELDVLYKKLIVEVKGHDKEVLKSYDAFVKQAARHLSINIVSLTKPRYHVHKYSVLRSVHIYKKHFSQFEERTHFSIFEFSKLTGSTADTFLEYIQRNLPEGVAMKVTRHRIEKLPDHLKPPRQKKAAITDT